MPARAIRRACSAAMRWIRGRGAGTNSALLCYTLQQILCGDGAGGGRLCRRPVSPAVEPRMRQPRCAAIILAAGNGTRMRSAIPKVMHPVAGRPMIAHILAALEPLRPAASIAVIGTQMGEVAGFVAPMETALQDPPLGTGDAVRVGLEVLADR